MILRNNDEYLYLQIAESIRRDIENGIYHTGDALPPIRDITTTWHCTIGTVQRAIRELEAEGLVVTHVGKRTRVIGPVEDERKDSLRKANLIHRAETFLLEVMAAGFDANEAEDAFRVAINRWQSVSQARPRIGLKNLRFSGSHDLAIAWIATHFTEIAPGYQLHLEFVGSMPGLQALAAGACDIAGSHLWDEQTNTYNTVFLQNLFPTERIAMVTLAQRRLGFITKPTNPCNIHSFEDLARPDVHFVNRNAGSGTRVYLDSMLKQNGISPDSIRGYEMQRNTHNEIAAEVGENHADVGIGLEAAARAYDLEFQFLTLERYDLVMRQKTIHMPAVELLISWLESTEFRKLLTRMGGYDPHESGNVHWT